MFRLQRSRTIWSPAAGCVLVAIGLLLPTTSLALSKNVFSTSFAGSGPSTLSNPSAVEVDQSTHDVYVADPANFRVEKFDSAGNFILMFGKGVDQTTGADVCTAASGDTCQSGTQSTSPGAFKSNFESSNSTGSGSGLYLALDNSNGPSAGDLYVGDPGDSLVSKFDSSGNLIASWGSGGQLDGSASPHGPFKDSDTMRGVAVDTSGDLFVLLGSSTMFEFSQDGGFITDFPVQPGEPLGLAVDGAHNFYVVRDHGVTKSSQTGFIGAVSDPFRAVSGVGLNPVTREIFVTGPDGKVEHFAASCAPIGQNTPCTPVDAFGTGKLSDPHGVAVDGSSDTVYVADTGNHRVTVFSPVPYLAKLSALSANGLTPAGENLQGNVDPAGAGDITDCHFDYVTDAAYKATGYADLSSGGSVPCDQATPIAGAGQVSADLGGLTYGSAYHFQLVATDSAGASASFDQAFTTLPQAPSVGAESVSNVSADAAQIHTEINPGGGLDAYHTTYRVEYVDDAGFQQSGFAGASHTQLADAGSARTPQPIVIPLSGLAQDTTYHYRVIATNATDTTTGAERTFTTFPFTSLLNDPCPNAHVRQQTGAALLLDCRAYELVSAANTGGYDVESSLVPGQTPFAGYPQADARVLYGIHNGAIPGSPNPTNHGVDPYVATRGADGWSTRYVGLPANDPYASGPFASTLADADASLDTFAFGGPGICSPCFSDGSTGNPIHLPDGSLVQGMAGSITPVLPAKPEGYIGKHLSADGSHLVFGSTSQFEPQGNPNNGNVTIYDRDLKAGTTQVVSTLPNASTIANGGGVAELDISHDGSRIVIGSLISTDSAGNNYYHLYMHVGNNPDAIDLTPGTTSGALYDGMSADGTKVYFTSADKLTGDDTDTSADIYRADVSGFAATLTRVSTGSAGAGNTDSCNTVADSAHKHWNMVGPAANCDAVAIGGGGGVASGDGSIYFLSPEQLDGASNGTPDAPNLYLARPGQAPHFIATLESLLTGPQPPKLRRSFDHNFGSSSAASGLAVDHTSGDVYVLDAGASTVQKFDSSGNPVNFNFSPGSKEAGGNQLIGADTPAGAFGELAGFGPNQLAVDQSNGDLYVPDLFNSVIDVFDSSGNYLPAKQISIPDFPTGVALDPSNGDVYVSGFFGFVYVFDSSGNPVSSFPTNGTPAAVAVDGNGSVYVTQFGGGETDAYDSSGNFVKALDTNATQGVAVDTSNGDVYVDEGNQVVRFDSSGNRLGADGSGVLSGSSGLAVDPQGNLYATNSAGASVAAFGPLQLVPSPLTDNPAVLDAVDAAGTRNTADFQVTPSGNDAVFPSTVALTGYDTAGHTEIYRYDATSGHLDCVSCAITGVPASGDASLAPNGLSLADDGRVFFTSSDALVSADTDNIDDAYEWEGGKIALVSAGTSTFDSRLLGASADGTDAYFFTRDSLVPQDNKNGATVKIYDARAGGGFPFVSAGVPCQASDECHGAGSPTPPVPAVRTVTGNDGNLSPPPKGCKKGRVKRHGRCVLAHHHKRRRHQRGGSK